MRVRTAGAVRCIQRNPRENTHQVGRQRPCGGGGAAGVADAIGDAPASDEGELRLHGGGGACFVKEGRVALRKSIPATQERINSAKCGRRVAKLTWV